MTSQAYPLVSWPVAGTTSAAIELTGPTPVGFYTPGTLAGTSFTFQTSTELYGTYSQVRLSNNSALTFNVGTGNYYGMTDAEIHALCGAKFFRIVSSTSEAAGTAVTVVTREVL